MARLEGFHRMASIRVARKCRGASGLSRRPVLCGISAVFLVFSVGCHSGGTPRLSSGAPSFAASAPVILTSDSPTSYALDFGDVAIGGKRLSGLTLTNVGTSPLQLLGLDAPTDSEFSVTPPAVSVLQLGAVVPILLSFAPSSVGAKSASMVVHTDSATAPDVTLHLTGAGVTVELQVSPLVVTFGGVVIHTVATQAITLVNKSPIELQVTPSALQGGAASLFTLDRSGGIALPAGQSTRLMASYAPLVPSPQDQAFFTLSVGVGAPISVALHGVALQNGLAESPSPLDFGFVQLGQQLTLPMHLANVGNLPVSISQIAVTNPGSPSAFALAAGAPQTALLAAGDSLDVGVTFVPTQMQPYAGTLQVVEDNTVQLSVGLQGYGGGAALSCAPLALGFGDAPVGLRSTLPIVCTNTGSDVFVAGSLDANAELKINGLGVSPTGVFSAALDTAALPGPLRAGQSTQIDVTYAPPGPEADAATLAIRSNVLAPPVIPLSGQGIVEKQCHYTLSPALLAWGQVRSGGKYTQAFIVSNVGPNECLVTGVALGASGDTAFSLPQGIVASQRLSAPGSGGSFPTSLVVPVAFAPPASGTFAGEVVFTISDPTTPSVRVGLSGSAGDNCFLVKPTELEFGAVGLSSGQFCSSVRRSFVGVNGCSNSVTIDAVTLVAAGSPFVVISDVVPVTIAPGQSSPPFEMGFRPTAAGAYAGGAMVHTDLQPMSFGVFFQGSALDGTQQTDQFQGHAAKIDVLFVSDTDDDVPFLASFAQHAQDFVTEAENLNLDFQMAVTTTAVCGTPDGEQGRLLPCPGCHIQGPAPKLITDKDPIAGSDLASLLPVAGAQDGCYLGTHDEQFFEAAFETLITNGATYNAGFIRPDAYLAVVQTNGDHEDDKSSQNTVQWYANQLLSIKGADHPELFSWSYINPSQLGSTNGHQPFDRLPSRIASMLHLVGGVALDETQSQWWLGLTDLWMRAAAPSTRFPLSGAPDPTTIRVYLDGPPPGQVGPGQRTGVLISPVANDGQPNYVYDPSANSLDINSASLSLGASDVLYVTYTLVCP
jgi:hypothetical protein